jgi:hypothetical protein
MRSLFGIATLPFVLICTPAGCASSADAQDELAGEAASSEALVSADSAVDGAYTYFGITADLRKCPSPLCGGWFLARVNQATTTCHDGRRAATCYTPVLDWSDANLSAAQQAKLLDASSKEAGSGDVYAVVRGQFARTNSTSQPRTGRFVISEAWIAEGTGVPDGTFVRVKDNGLRCFAAPCPSVTETTLNMSRTTDIAAVDFTPAGLTEREVEGCLQDMTTPGGILVAGYRYTVTENGVTANARSVTAAYDRLSDAVQ